MTALVIGYVIGLKLALMWAVKWGYDWRQMARTWLTQLHAQDTEFAEVEASAQTVIDTQTQRALVLVAENQRLRNALANVRGIIGRRPPRRRWLALARRVAALATIGGAVACAGPLGLQDAKPCHPVLVDSLVSRCS